MSLKIKIEDWYNLHKGFQLTLEPGYTALVGPNGAGKTTILSQLQEYAKENGIRVWEYSNLKDGGHVATNQYMCSGNIEGFAASATCSEGEYLAYNFANQVKGMAQAVKQAAKDKHPILVLLDAIDSGASIDRARELMGFLNNVCKTEFKNGVELYIVMAVNHYELAKAPANCINVRTGHLSALTATMPMPTSSAPSKTSTADCLRRRLNGKGHRYAGKAVTQTIQMRIGIPIRTFLLNYVEKQHDL